MSESDTPPPEPSASPKAPHRAEERAEAGIRLQWLHVLALVLATAAVIGFITGTRGDQDPYRRPEHEAPREDTEGLALTPSYADIRGNPLGPNRDRHAAAIAAMRADRPALTDEDIPPRDDEAVQAELERRGELRSYNGAPPRIPHAIAPRGPLECAGCHLEGMRVGGLVARPMSHSPELSSCTQCHVPAEGQLPGARLEGGPPLDNGFAGMEAPTRGPRMWEGAPPQIPHTTLMRERCDSCHGVWGTGIRTTHPWRQSCEQCHTRSGAMDQHPSTLEGGPPASPMPGEGS